MFGFDVGPAVAYILLASLHLALLIGPSQHLSCLSKGKVGEGDDTSLHATHVFHAKPGKMPDK